MAEVEKNPDQSQSEESGEISLENIDEILQQEDPGFVDSLSDIKEAADDVSDVELESLDIDVDSDGDDIEESEGRFERIFNRILARFPRLKVFAKIIENTKKFFRQRILIWRGKTKLWFFNAKEHLKTWPDRLKKVLSDVKGLLGLTIGSLKKSFGNRTRIEKGLILLLFFGSGVFVGLILLNVKHRRWIPLLNPPLLTSLAEVADGEWEYDIETGTLPFLSAFPQTKHNYLFPKVIVNLKSSGNDSFQMGAFEFYVEVDSKDTAVEVKSREVELHDLIQRVVEGFSYDALQTEKGKDRLKEEIKKALNQKIVQGWVKGVYIKFMITKP